MVLFQNMVGAAAHKTTELIASTNEGFDKFTATIKEFEDSEIEMKDPRSKAAEIFDSVRGTFFLGKVTFHLNCFRQSCG